MAPFNNSNPIMIGAEIFIEPGQTKAEITEWFRIMKAGGMEFTRIRMFENYMRQQDGTWNFELFDHAFRSGEKYGIKIYANLFPETEFSDVGGFKFPKSAENLQRIASYIENIVKHFDQFTSLYGWVPINEPGSGDLPDDTFTREKFVEWKENLEKPSYNSSGFTTFELAEQRFLLTYNCWFLEWLTAQIRLYDSGRPIHVNNHDIFRNVAEYDFPRWREFLTSLGGSAHASWHFEYFSREKYALAMSANAEILRSGAGNIPWFMTELQGGNNTYSGHMPMCPTKEEIAQWLWVNIGSGSRGAMFWCLNSRRSGYEAGEWALLDFQNNASDRLETAIDVCSVISENQQLFNDASVVDSGINVLYIRESMWIEKALQIKGSSFEGREVGGVMKSALAYFEVLSELGIHANFKEIAEFDFSKDDYGQSVIILSHQISIPSKYWPLLEHFVAKGGKLIADGLTGYYDENAYFIMGQDFPLKVVFGGSVKEFKLISNLFKIELNEPSLAFQAHLWMGSLSLLTGKPLGYFEDQTIASRNTYGQGEVLWIPSLLGLGARITNDYNSLSRLLSAELSTLPLRFKDHHKGLLMKTLKQDTFFITILVNKSKAIQHVAFNNENLKKPLLLFSNKGGNAVDSQHITIKEEETLVIKWLM